MRCKPLALPAKLPPLLATAKSCLPSALKSPTLIPCGALPTLTSGTAGAVKPPSPFPKRTDTVSASKFVEIMSTIPSRLKSPKAILEKVEPEPAVGTEFVCTSPKPVGPLHAGPRTMFKLNRRSAAFPPVLSVTTIS